MEMTENMSKRKSLTKKEREVVYEKCNHRCAYCGCEIDYKDMQVDHIKSVYVNADLNNNMTLDEANESENLLPACRQCNFYKSTFTIETFRKRLKSTMLENLKKEFNYRLALKYGLITENDIEVQFYYEKIGIALSEPQKNEQK